MSQKTPSSLSYKDAGVDIDAGNALVERIKREVDRIFDTCEQSRRDALEAVSASKELDETRSRVAHLSDEVARLGGRYERLQVQLDEDESSLKLTRRGDAAFQAEFSFERPTPDALRWSGVLEGHPVRLSFARLPEREYLLVQRGFHWINEVPFNR